MKKADQQSDKSIEIRTLRLIRLIQEIRDNPAQRIENILESFKISRSQFYKDRTALSHLGFVFIYRKSTGFSVVEDRLTPITDFSLSERLTLLFALEHLSACGDGLLAARAVEVGRKLAGGLESPFKEQLQRCFDSEVTKKIYGVQPEVYTAITTAVAEGRRIRMLYLRGMDWTERWRIVDPRRVYMRQRSLYLYARTADETPSAWKVFRLGRIKTVQQTGMRFAQSPNDDDGFYDRQRHAFCAFIGESPRTIKIRFTGAAIPYVMECNWHHSQTIQRVEDGSIFFSVTIAEPLEVVRWARQFGADAEVIDIEDPSQM